MLDGSEFSPESCPDRSAKDRLLRDADAAFQAHDRERCVEAISKLYGIFDREHE